MKKQTKAVSIFEKKKKLNPHLKINHLKSQHSKTTKQSKIKNIKKTHTHTSIFYL